MSSKASDYRVLHKAEADASQAAFTATIKDDLAAGKTWAGWLGPGLLPLTIAFLVAAIVAGRHATSAAKVLDEMARRLRDAVRRSNP